MKISASIYSRSSRPLEDVVRELDLLGIDSLHVDCNDDPRVFDDVSRIRAVSRTPVDLHVISAEPARYADLLEENRVESVAFQAECFRGPIDLPAPHGQVGLALTCDTPVTAFDAYADVCSFVLVMTTRPGQSGGTFSPRGFGMIRELKRRHPTKRVHVDGGVNDDVADALRRLGVHCAVSGSYLLRAEDQTGALLRLRSREGGAGLRVADVMLRRNELPIVDAGAAGDPRSLLAAIDGHRLGFCLVTGGGHELLGVVSDGDVRRAVLRKLETASAITSADLVNPRPITIAPGATLRELFGTICHHSRPVVFVPVVDTQRALVGAVLVASVLRGES